EECIEITAEPNVFSKISEYLESKAYTMIEAEIKMVPSIKKELSESEIEKFENFINKLEDNDDVQSVWHNADY
ncbi:MAG: YebC/PmpR family DNA-binding transcriptional regulator, partial [Clostridia bacterium]|nr:YebC/PmpR family DNA-binding transcriptional regulator [Clostridia bacterium]